MLAHGQDSLNTNGLSSYPCQSDFQNCIKLIVKEASDGFPDSDQLIAVGRLPNGAASVAEVNLDPIQVRIAKEKAQSRTIGDLLSLSPRAISNDCPTFTPKDLATTSPTTEYPGGERVAVDVRGSEVARLEEDPEDETGKWGHLDDIFTTGNYHCIEWRD
jgi:hypothetical protein